jgi:hypothetical protein
MNTFFGNSLNSFPHLSAASEVMLLSRSRVRWLTVMFCKKKSLLLFQYIRRQHYGSLDIIRRKFLHYQSKCFFLKTFSFCGFIFVCLVGDVSLVVHS